MARRSQPGHSDLRSLGSADTAPSPRLPPGWAGGYNGRESKPEGGTPHDHRRRPQPDLLRQVQGQNGVLGPEGGHHEERPRRGPRPPALSAAPGSSASAPSASSERRAGCTIFRYNSVCGPLPVGPSCGCNRNTCFCYNAPNQGFWAGSTLYQNPRIFGQGQHP